MVNWTGDINPPGRMHDVRTVNEFTDDYLLINTSQDIAAICDTVGIENRNYGMLFIKTDPSHADYDEVWASILSVPYHDVRMFKVFPKPPSPT